MEDALYRALVDPTRRRIMDLLARSDGLSLFEICGRLIAEHRTPCTRQAISQHLAVLGAADLVRSERVGRTKLHHLDTGPLRSIIERWPVDR